MKAAGVTRRAGGSSGGLANRLRASDGLDPTAAPERAAVGNGVGDAGRSNVQRLDGSSTTGTNPP